MKRLLWTVATALGLASPAFAHASEAYVISDVDLASGPDQDYPVIDRLEQGSVVDIQGCTPGWAWCDVVAYGERGWVPANALEFDYQNQWVAVPEYAPRYNVPIVTFSIQSYWDTWYVHRPFYVDRRNWYGWRPPHRQRPFPVDFPPPHPFHGPPVRHHPIDYPPPYHRGGPPPHPVDYPPPYHHGNPPPHPVDYPPPYHGNPPPRVVPMPHPVNSTTPVPRPAPNVQPASHPVEQPKASSKNKDSGGQR